MRNPTDPTRLLNLLQELGRRARGPGRIYLVGGASALLVGWRDQTVDVDLKLDPEPAGIFEAIAKLKNELGVNIELAAPDQFLPEVAGWRERSPSVGRFGSIEVHHYDFCSQALAKLSRWQDRDRSDVAAMLERGLVGVGELRRAFEEIKPKLIRFPAIEPELIDQRIASLEAAR